MDTRGKRLAIGCAVAVGTIIVIGAAFAIFASLAGIYTDWLWFESMGQLRAYQTRLWTQVGLWGGAALLAIIVLAINWFLIPGRALTQLELQVRDRRRRPVTVSATMMSLSMTAAAIILALTMAGAAREKWLDFLMARHAVPFGMEDPIFGQDIGFYVFQLPLYRFLVTWTLSLIVATLVGSLAVYAFSQRLRSRTALAHLSILGAMFLGLKTLDYWLKRYLLLNSTHGVVYGAGYTDLHAQLPLLYGTAIVAAIGALALIINIFVRSLRLMAAVGAVLIIVSILGPLYPAFVQRFIVQPNELALETPNIERNIALTRFAYNIDNIQELDYQIAANRLTMASLEANADTLDNVRLWDWRPLRTTYEQLQEIRTYYTFLDVDVDRYILNGQPRQVTLAARELDVEQLRQDARTWINQHLIYTHGYGLCLSPVAEASEEGLPVFLVRDIPPRSSDPALTITRPEIYFGEATDNYIIVGTSEQEFDYPRGDSNEYTRYAGPDGVSLSSGVRRLAFALRFNSIPILVSGAIGPESRILFHRTLYDRASTLAPMLWYDSDPYPVIADGRIIWLYDAYTWTSRFPYSEPVLDDLNYARNSVKITIDAYTGEIRFYVVDPSDPLIQVYQSIFPDLFTPGDQMPAALREHWRYPEKLFNLQAAVYAAYHMRDPRVFYNQEDLWQTPREQEEVGGGTTEMPAYYVILRLPGSESAEFMMIRPYVPAGKENMIAWLYADSDGEDYGTLGIFKFSKDALVYGPMQIEGRFNQDTYISQQLTLWNQEGSSVLRGNLLVIPIDGTLLYIEPLYLQAQSGRLPELKRVLVAYENRVAMGETLETALMQVLGEAPSPETISPAAGDAAALARSARAHYEAALECLQQADWACYGAEMEALEENLDALVEATRE